MEEKLIELIGEVIGLIADNTSSPTLVKELNETLSILMGQGRR